MRGDRGNKKLMAKASNIVDVYVGARLRMRRTMLGMSQSKLGELLGVTFQQIQKYEKGSNRIGSSRLAQIATRLNVPVAFFFQGLEQKQLSGSDARELGLIDSLLSTKDGLRLARSRQRNGHISQRVHVVDSVLGRLHGDEVGDAALRIEPIARRDDAARAQ